MIKRMPDRPVGGFGPNWPVFVHLAAEARDAAIQVEEADPRAWPMRDALGAILFSALAAEAFINELYERPAVACQVAASAQPRMEGVQQRSADFAEFHRSERGQDRAPDVTRIGIPGGWVQLSNSHVPGEHVSDRDIGVGPPPICDLS